MKKIKLSVEGVSPNNFNPQNTYVLILSDEETGKRKLPIIIGALEAQAISLALENIKTPRPLTIDLLSNILKETNINVKEVTISNLEKGVFFATILLGKNGEEITIDSRVSDAIALALRTKSPIYILKHIFDDNAFSWTAEKEKNIIEPQEEVENYELKDNAWLVQYLYELKVKHDINKLKKILNVLSEEKLAGIQQVAIEEEKYEVAAFIRDEINARKG